MEMQRQREADSASTDNALNTAPAAADGEDERPLVVADDDDGFI